jgi:diguanylate cyclase (GGDEF)-like protein
MASLCVTVACAACVVAIVACLRTVRAMRLRLRLVQRREAQFLSSIEDLLRASRTSAGAVLESLERSLRCLDPAIDALALFVPEQELVRCTYASGDRCSYLLGTALSRALSELLPARVARNGHGAALVDSSDAMLPADRDAVAVALRDGEVLLGVAYVASSAAALGDRDAVISMILHASVPYAIACERERDRATATFDGLTGLLTPRAFRDVLRDEIARARLRNGAHAAIWFIDTDEFKRINDTLGHAAGDIVLQQMARLLRAHAVPDHDVAGRNGGDEFLMLLRNVPKTRAIDRAEAFADAVRTHDFGVGVTVSASIGVAAYPFDASTSNALLELADAAMYYSKRSGRDRVSYPIAPGQFAEYERSQR